MSRTVLFRSVLVLCLASLAAAGCGKKEPGSAALPDGCYTGDAVPADVKAEVLAAAETFYGRLREQKLQEIYDNAAAAVRQKEPAKEFLQAIVRAATVVGVPRNAELHAIQLVKFGPGLAYAERLTCASADTGGTTILMLGRQPEQASLVQTAPTGGETIYFSTLWIREEGEWRLGTFFAKPATLYGKDWREYEQEAKAQNEKKHLRNSALLYNVAIDLAVAAPWVKPPEIDHLQRDQRRLQVEYLPAGGSSMDVWGAAPDSFVVNKVAYAARSDGLGLIVSYLAQGDIADSTFQDTRARELVKFIREHFPEYLEVFQSVSIQAFDYEDRDKTWFQSYPLRSREP